MIYSNIQFVTYSTESLAVGSYVPKDNWSYIADDSRVYTFPLGHSDREFIDFTVFGIDGTYITGSLIKPDGAVVSGQYTNSLSLIGDVTKSLFLDVAEQFRDLGINDGNYKVGIQVVREMVGSATASNHRLMINDISPSRTEVSLIPTTLKSSTNPSDVSFLNDFTLFATSGLNDPIFGGYFSNYLTFGNGESIAILNTKLITSSLVSFHDSMVLKLANPLSQGALNGTNCWITNLFAASPVVQDIHYFTKTVIKTYPLRGPDFNIKLENAGNGTEVLSFENVIGQTGSMYDELSAKYDSKLSSSFLDTIDYTKFENFINFSSAQYRLTSFADKIAEINSLTISSSYLDTKISLNPSDSFYVTDKKDLQRRILDIESSFDGYERFLYRNPAWYDSHSMEYGTESSASLYDKENRGSLIHGLPEFIVENGDNADYITFTAMIGHFFDNISIFIKQFTEKNNHANAPKEGISTDIVDVMLRSLGWEPEISRENLPVLLSSFSKSDFEVSSSLYNMARGVSEIDRNKIIWKRLLNTLPYIYKTKGTESSINAIISCFGIPPDTIKIKEYGGINSSIDSSDQSVYVIDGVKYEPTFSGSGEYFLTNSTGSIMTAEFNVSFDPDHVNPDGKYFYLVSSMDSSSMDDKWNIGVVKDRGEVWGRMFFNISGSETKVILTDKVPIFDGNTYSVMLRRNLPHQNFNLETASAQVVDAYPIQYDLFVTRAHDTRIVFSVSGSQILNAEHNNVFRMGNSLRFGDLGGYDQSGIRSTSGSFFGTLDEIKLWESPISNESFNHHVLYRGAYDAQDPQTTVEKDLVHISFEIPINLYTSSGQLTLDNLSFRSEFPTFKAINFPKVVTKTYLCTMDSGTVKYTESEKFPYQFNQNFVEQTISVPSYGSSKFKSNKINYIQQTLVSSLSPLSRSSIPISQATSTDSNKLGVFVSPIDSQNEEILKFFGNFRFEDLIGDPSNIYDSTYKKYEKFKEIYYDQGMSTIDYQSFMNMARSYLDKSMFTYIKSVVPARAKLVEGILVEPTILERPKIMFREPTVNISSSFVDVESYYVSGSGYIFP